MDILTSEGLKVDPAEVVAIRKMPRPTDAKGVMRSLGMVNYLAKFCENLSELCVPLGELTHKDVIWEWAERHEQTFERIKTMISQNPVLKYYNPADMLTLQCDASESRLERPKC